MFAWQFARMLDLASYRGKARFVTMQNHYNLIYREEEREMIPLCLDQGIGVLPWSPLARGFLAGARRKEDYGDTVRAKTDDYAKGLYYQDADFAVVERLKEVAGRRGLPMARVALAWLLSKPAVTAPIVGATKREHLEEAVAALDVRLEAGEIRALEEPYTPHRVLGHS
jgi:aryl-alcohol dehydrogenase-like predicted oxidoreductase